MSPFNLGQDPQHFVRIFGRYVCAAVMVLAWMVVALASVLAAYGIVRLMWAGMLYLQKAITG